MTFHNLVLNSYGEYISPSTLTNQLGKMLNYISYTNGVIYPVQQKSMDQHPKVIKNDLQKQSPHHQRWIPANQSHLFQITNKKLSLQSNNDSCCLRKKVLVKQILKKLQPNKRHAMILLPVQQQQQQLSSIPIYPPKPTYHPKTYFPISSSSLLSHQQQLHYHHHYNNKKSLSPKVKLPCPKINTTMIQRKRHSPPSPISPPNQSKPKCILNSENNDNNDDDDDVPLGTLITQKC